MNLKELRKKHKKTQEEIAQILNTSQRSYCGYELETNEPTIETLCKLADYYNVSLDYLVGRHFANDIGFLDEQERAIVKLVCQLNETNKIKVASYISGMLAIQD